MSLLNQITAWLMPRAAKSWPLENQIQAQALSGILAEEGIPHKIRRNGLGLFGYSESVQEGWGRLEAEEAFHAQVEQIYQDFLVSVPGEPEES